MRKPDWPSRMLDILDEHVERPFAWGVSDCGILFADAVVAQTGFDPLAGMRGYRTKAGALRVLRRAGFASVAELVAARFEEIPLAQAGRGDLGLPEVADALTSPAVITGALAVSKDENGPVTLSRSLIKRAFKVF
ncbi:MAG: hypothetical protein C0605_07945 [Hyphomicrobiales bacterium]|nr:MAG: hypothetical protein C0605_07945 [Hyphomicrobiales bacterium]